MTSSLVLSIVTFVYGLSAVLYISSWIFNRKLPGTIAFYTAIVAAAGNLAGFVLRWIETYKIGYGHIPLSNQYESLVFFALTIASVCIVLEYKYKTMYFNAFAIPLAFLAMAFAALKASGGEIQPLIPALKSNWLTAHVVTCFLGYAGFAIAFGISIMHLVKQRVFVKHFSLILMVLFSSSTLIYLVYAKIKTKTTLLEYVSPVLPQIIWGGVGLLVFIIFMFGCRWLLGKTGFGEQLVQRLPEFEMLDEVHVQTVMFGFLFLTVGIITGSVWANSAWGKYWSWDPKETWSLITWFVYAILLHLRYMRDWGGKQIALVSIIGFAAVMFTYFGVNFLPGLHSYAN